jgi:hypothetical protein
MTKNMPCVFKFVEVNISDEIMWYACRLNLFLPVATHGHGHNPSYLQNIKQLTENVE